MRIRSLRLGILATRSCLHLVYDTKRFLLFVPSGSILNLHPSQSISFLGFAVRYLYIHIWTMDDEKSNIVFWELRQECFAVARSGFDHSYISSTISFARTCQEQSVCAISTFSSLICSKCSRYCKRCTRTLYLRLQIILKKSKSENTDNSVMAALYQTRQL